MGHVQNIQRQVQRVKIMLDNKKAFLTGKATEGRKVIELKL